MSKYRGYGIGVGSMGPNKLSSRISHHMRANNNNYTRQYDDIKPPDIIKKLITSRSLLLVDASYENRYLPLLRHLIDVGYIQDSIDIIVVKNAIDDIEPLINDYYKKGYRLFFGAQNSSVFIGLCLWFKNHPDTMYFNYDSKIWLKDIDNHFPENMITICCNFNRIIDFIFKNIMCNIHQHIEHIKDSVFSDIFDFVDEDNNPDGQVFNQIVYVCDNTDLFLKDNCINVIKDYIKDNFKEDTQFNDKVTLQTFVLNIDKDSKNDSFMFPDKLDALLSENMIDLKQFANSQTKSIFIFDCFDSANCQNMLKYFSKKEYYRNLIVFNDKFLNVNVNDGLNFYSKFDFKYSFILALSYSELGYKISKRIFGDYNTPSSFLEIFSHIPDIFDRIVKTKIENPIKRLIEYLANSYSLNTVNEWHVKPLYLYGLREKYDENLSRWNFYSSVTIYKKLFNDATTGTQSPDESWIDTAISGYSSAIGAVSYSSNSSAYNSSVTNSNLNGVTMLFTTISEIADYYNKLNTFFSNRSNSTPAIFGIWKSLGSLSSTNDSNIMSMNTNSVQTIQIYVTVPSQALNNGSSCNKNHWLHINSGPISYTYYSYDVHGTLLTGSFTDTVTIDLDMTYSTDNYHIFFNKGNNYNGVRGPLRVHFTVYATQVTNKLYRIGDIVTISSSSLGSNVAASIDSISSDGFTFDVTRFENDNTNGITSTVLKQNKGVLMSLANASSIATMGVNPDITNVANNSLNMWSQNGCYYLALVPTGWVVAYDYRNVQTFWSSGSGVSNLGPGTLQFRVSNTNYLKIEVLDSSKTVRKTILNYNVNNPNLLVYPLQLTITNDRNIAIINANTTILWSEVSGISLSLSNGTSISNKGDNGSLYSLNGTYNLSLSNNGVLNFRNIFNNKVIYSVTNSTANYLKFSYTTNTTTNITTFTLGLYNSSNQEVYDIFKDGSLKTSNSFDVENHILIALPFSEPYSVNLTNNGDIVIGDVNNNTIWCLGKADKTTVTQDCYAMVNGTSTLTSSPITNITYVQPRQGDFAIIHTPKNQLYNGATATIALVNSDKSINVIFYDNDDANVRTKRLKSKPELRSILVSDKGETSSQNFMPVSHLELFNLTSSNGYYSAIIDNNNIKVKDNRTSRENWRSPSLVLSLGQTIRKCNGLKIDNDTGSLYIDIISENLGNSTSTSQNINLTANVNYTLEFYASGNNHITVTISALNNGLQPLITFTFTPTNSDLTLFTQSFTTVTTGTFSMTFSSNTIIQNISITNEDKYYLFQNSGENILDGNFDSTTIANNSYLIYTNVPLNNWSKVQGALISSYTGNSYPLPYPTGNYAFSFGQGSGLTQNIYLLAGSDYSLSFFASSYIGNGIYQINIVVTITPQTTNSSQQTISYTVSPTNAWQQFSKSFSINASDNYTVSFIASGLQYPGYNAIQGVSILTKTGSYSLNMQDDGHLCLYQNGSDEKNNFKWGSDSWQTESWTSNSGVITVYEYWNQLSPPKVISTNGYYYLSMDYGTLGIMSYKNGGYDWVDNTPFRYIGMPLFYSNASKMGHATIETSSSTSYYTVYSNGSVYTNSNNSATGGYWSNIYSNIMNTFSPGVGPVVANDVQVVWTNSTATTDTGSNNGKTLNFSYTYNNPTGEWIWSQLWVSVLSKCDVYINNTKIGSVGGSSSSSWNNFTYFDFNLPPGNTTFKFVAYNSSGRAGLAFLCIAKYISSCDLFISGSTGNLMAKNVMILTETNKTVSLPGVSDLTGYSITNFSGTGPGPYTMSFDDDGSGGSDGTLSIINGVGTTIFSSNSGTSLVASLPGPSDRQGILNTGVKLYAQQDESELQDLLWSPSGYSFFGITLDTVTKTQSVCIFDARFTKPVYTFYTANYTTLSSVNAISYLMVSNAGAIVVNNVLGSVMWKTSDISGYSNYSLKLNDSNMLSILGNNNSITLTTFNQTWGTYESSLLSIWNGAAYYSSGNSDFASLLRTKPPWGIYAAESYSNNVLHELRENGRNATCSGVTLTNGSGYGATADIPYIYGSTTSNVTWPTGSIPTNFTVCSITRYTGGTRNRILTATSGNWLHGHWGNNSGVCYYDGWLTSYGNGYSDNWVITCSNNNGIAPNNVLVNGSAIGTVSGGGKVQRAMSINICGDWPHEVSDWALSYVFIWDQTLTDAELRIVSNGLSQYLTDGVSINTLINGGSERGERLLTSSSGDYILSLDNGSLNINNVIDSSYSGSSSGSSSHVKDINNYTLYSQLYTYTGSDPYKVHMRFMSNGTYIVCHWSTSYLMWGDSLYPYTSPSTAITAQSYSRLPDGNWVYMYYQNPYTKMVSDTGEARYYNGVISSFNPNSWSTYTLNTGHYNLNIVPLYTFGVPNVGIPNYKLILGNTGELAIYDSSIPRAVAIDSGSISQCSGWSNVYNMFNFASLLKNKPPWGIYAAESYSNNVLYELRGNGRNATCSGVTLTNGSGNGSAANIPYIYGSTTSKVTWPTGSIPTNFTVCSITRYTGTTNNKRILTATSGNWLHGHWGNNSGVCYYDGWLTSNVNGPNNTTWVITCGKNNGTAPNNILVNGTVKGTVNGGSGGQTAMTINNGYYNEPSDWAFSHVFIWDQTLTDSELIIVSNGLSQYLNNGISINNLNNFTSFGLNNYRWLWNTANSYSSAPAGTVNFYTSYTNTRNTNITATLWCRVDDTLDVYMNGIKLSNSALSWNTIISNTITLTAGSTSLFKFVATNGGGGAGLIFWCLENGNTNDATNTLFFSNPDTVYCSDGIYMNPDEFGIQTWNSKTAYSEKIEYSNYTIDTSDIPENQLVSNEYNYKIPSSNDDTEEYTKIYSQNRLYYLRLLPDGALVIYLSISGKIIWHNRRYYSGSNNAARIGFVYGNDGNGTFGLWDSKGLSYGNTIPVLKEIIYIFYLGNDLIMRLVGSDGSSVIFTP